MKRFLVAAFILSSLFSYAQNASRIHERISVVDTHDDVLSRQLISGADLGKRQSTGAFDLVKAKEGGLDVQIFSVWCGDDYGKGTAFKHANREIDSLYALIKRYPRRIQFVHNIRDIAIANRTGKMAAAFGVEGGHMIEDRLDYIDSLAKRGMVYLTLTWNNSTSWATSARDERFKKDSLPHFGLTDLGKQVVKRLNDLNIMVDVSHVGEQTFWDVLKTSTKPVIASHSCVYSLCPHQRNLKDDQLKAIAEKGGVVFVNFYSGFLDSTYSRKQDAFLKLHKTELDSLEKVYKDYDRAVNMINARYKAESDAIRAPLSLLIKHIDYMVKLIGADHVGIGADFEGAESYPLGLDSVADYPKVTAALLALNYSLPDVEKIMGGNFLRVWAKNKPR